MRKALLTLVPLLAVLALAPVVGAEDVFPPPWELPVPDGRGTYQGWEFWTEDNPILAEIDENPYGDPVLTMELDWDSYGTEPGWDGTNSTWHVGPAGGKHSIQIHNADTDGIRKEVWVQVTSTAPPISVGGQPGHGATTTPHPGTILGTDPSGYTWSVNPYLVTFPGNPSMEYIEIYFEYCTWVEEIIIHTRCVPIPEPSLIGLVGLGGLLFLRKRKK